MEEKKGYPVEVDGETVYIVKKVVDDASRPSQTETLYDADGNAYKSVGVGQAKKIDADAEKAEAVSNYDAQNGEKPDYVPPAESTDPPQAADTEPDAGDVPGSVLSGEPGDDLDIEKAV